MSFKLRYTIFKIRIEMVKNGLKSTFLEYSVFLWYSRKRDTIIIESYNTHNTSKIHPIYCKINTWTLEDDSNTQNSFPYTHGYLLWLWQFKTIQIYILCIF